jgi:triosephosphate isomerase
MNSKKPVLIGVWKNRLTYNESIAASKQLASQFEKEKYPFICGVAPTPIALAAVKSTLDQCGLVTCAQNVMWLEEKGTYIGETTIPMLSELDISYVILGHSERRTTFEEGNELISRKAIDCISKGLVPIVCVGDTAEERAGGQTWNAIERQVQALLESDSITKANDLILAYEPMWAISTWRTDEPLPTGEIIAEIQADIRQLVEKIRGKDFATDVKILYGGSVNPKNGQDYMLRKDVDGALIGGASLTPESLIGTFDACLEGYLGR